MILKVFLIILGLVLLSFFIGYSKGEQVTMRKIRKKLKDDGNENCRNALNDLK